MLLFICILYANIQLYEVHSQKYDDRELLHASQADNLSMIGYRHFLMSFIWFIIVIIIAILVIKITPFKRTKEIHSCNREFNPESNPSFFIHMTDIHVSHYKHTNNEHYKNALEFCKFYKSDVIVNSGDLADNWENVGTYKQVAGQNEEDFKLYREINAEYAPKCSLFLDASGNHDQFNLYSLDISTNYYINSATMFQNRNIDYEEFVASSYIHDNNAFIVVNPFNYPRERALDPFLFTNSEVLDIIEKKIVTIQNEFPDKSIILITHFTVEQFNNVKSQTGKRFKDIITSYNISVVLTGHTHPRDIIPQHHEESLEINCSEVVSHQSVGIVTNDNGNIFYHRYHALDRPSFVPVYPIPSNQLSKFVSFSNGHIFIRVLVFSDDQNLNLLCDGYKMDFVRSFGQGMSLYQLERNYDNGFHNIKFELANETNEYEFFVGEKLPPKTETIADERQMFKYPLFIYLLLFIILFIITFPAKIEKSSDNLKNYMEQIFSYQFNKKDGHSGGRHFLNVIFGFLSLRYLLLNYNYTCMIYLFVILLVPLFCPISLMEVGGNIGIYTVYGYTNFKGSIRSSYTYLYLLLHATFVTLPLIFLSSILPFTKNFSYWFIIDIVYYVLALGFCIFFSAKSLARAFSFKFSIINLPFMLIPIISLIVVLAVSLS